MLERSPSTNVNATNVTQLIDSRPLSGLQLLTFVLGALVVLLDGANTIVISVAAPSIAANLGLQVSAFGPIFSAGQAGLLIGALGLGLLADRFGRKRLVILSTVLFGLFTLLTAWAGTFDELLWCRLLAGIGLGGAAPNIIALISEYAPRRIRSSLVSLSWAAFPLGGVVTGFAGAALANEASWRTLFYYGGGVPLALALLLLVALPESPAFLITRGANMDRIAQIARIVAKIAPDLKDSALGSFAVSEQKLPGVPVKHLFAGGRATGTLFLWVPFFAIFLILVTVNAWTPALLRAGGLSVSRAAFAIALNSIGSVIGCIIVGRLMDRLGAYSVLTTTFLGATLCVSALGFATANFGLVAAFTTLSGFFAGAGQAGVIALAAVTYPVAIRSTGVGWAMAVGRFGAVVGPLLGGIELGWGWPVHLIFLSIALPGLFGAAFVLLIRQRSAVR